MSRQAQPPTLEQLDILSWTASLSAVTAEALALRLDIRLAAARARLSVVQRRGLLSRVRPLTGCPALFTITRAGLRACGARGIEPCRIAPHGVQHLIVCASVAAAIERCYPDHRLIGERELRRDERDHGGPIASARVGSGRADESPLHRPDLVLWPNDPDGGAPVAVEVELTVKAQRRLVEICRAWARCRAVDGVLYLATPEVERALSRALAHVPACEQIVVVPLTGLPGLDVVATNPQAPHRVGSRVDRSVVTR
jgi:hypothetical protein